MMRFLLLLLVVATVASAQNPPPAAHSPIAAQRKLADSQRDPSVAVRAYEQLARLAANQEPETVAYALLQQGIWRQRGQRGSEAVAIWQRLRRFHPDSPHAATALWLEAQAAATAAQGERLQEELVAKYPNSPETATVLWERGQAAFDRQEYAAAVNWWGELVRRFPRHARVAAVRPALEIARLAVTGKEEEADGLALAARADKLYDKAEFALAAGLYRQALARLAGQEEAAGRATLRLAQCQFVLGDTREALRTLEEAVRRLPAQGAKLLGQLVEQSGGNPQMDGIRQRATEMLLARFPESYEAQMALFVNGAVAKARGQRAEAEQIWQGLLAKYPETAFRAVVTEELRTEAEKGALAREQARRAAAEEAARQKKQAEAVAAKRVAEQNAAAEAKRKEEELRRYNKDRAAYWEQRYRNIEVSLEDRAMAAYMMGHYYIVRNQDEAARMMYRWVWENAPQSPWAAEAGLATAQLWLRRGESAKAEQALEWAATKFSSTAAHKWILFTIGNRHLCYHADRQKAWHFYERLLAEYPDDKLAETTRKHWAEVKKLPDAELRRQAQALRDKEREAKAARDHKNQGER